jgi:hypothetical protein
VAIQNFFTSRDNRLDGNTYVGNFGRLWYNPDTNSIYASDGVTVGGVPVDLATGADILANNITVTQITSTSGNVSVTGNLVISGNISPATETKVGGIKAGPGANVSNDGTLTIDTAGLPLSFGDFTANTNILTLVNVDQNMVLATNGSAEVQLVGNIGFYKTDGFPPNIANRYFNATEDGQIQIFVSNVDPTSAAVEIVGSTSGQTQSPINTGVMLHITGQNNDPSRLYNDAIGDYAGFIARRYNGLAAAPTAVLDGDEIARLGINAYTSSGWLNIGQARISFVSTDNQSSTAQGSKIEFWSTPKGTTVDNRVKVLELNAGVGANVVGNVSASTFVGNLSGTAATATNLAAATGILAGSLSIDPASVAGASAAVQTFTLTGLTTNHKIVITSGTALAYGLIISAAWASAPNTLSIEFQNVDNQSIDPGVKNIQYFAWV